MSQAAPGADTAERLLALSADERAEQLRALEPAALLALIADLGQRKDSQAATLLVTIDAEVADKAARKAARTALHRLRAAGVQPPAVDAAPSSTIAAPPATRAPDAEPSEAWATDIDPGGSRAVSLYGERRLGGAWLASFILNDRQGITDFVLIDTTRKRYRKVVADWQADSQTTWIQLPPAYAQQLVREAVELSRQQHRTLPASYARYRPALGEAASGPERALIYETISPVAASFNPGWLERSIDAASTEQTLGWFIELPPELRERALEVARSPFSPLLVPGNTPPEQVRRLIQDIVRNQLTPELRGVLKRRFEETAYVFHATGREQLAQELVAAAGAVGDPGVGIERQPLLQVLLARGLSQLLDQETAAGRPARDVIYSLVEEAFAPGAEPAPATSQSGLILPR